MIHQHTLQTSAAFDRINDALIGDTNDSLSELIEELEHLLYKAKEIKNTITAMSEGYDYQPQSYCDLPSRF